MNNRMTQAILGIILFVAVSVGLIVGFPKVPPTDIYSYDPYLIVELVGMLFGVLAIISFVIIDFEFYKFIKRNRHDAYNSFNSKEVKQNETD